MYRNDYVQGSWEMKKQLAKNVSPCVIQLKQLLQFNLGNNFITLYHFGSRTDGTFDVDSDYDFLCVTGTSLSRGEIHDVIDKCLDIQIQHHAVFDLHFYSLDEIDSPPLSYSPLILDVKEHGVAI